MIQEHLKIIQDHCDLSPDQINVIRAEMAHYALKAIYDSKVAQQVNIICSHDTDQLEQENQDFEDFDEGYP